MIIILQVYENDAAMETVLFEAGFENIISSPIQDTSKITDKMMEYCKTVLGDLIFAKKEVYCKYYKWLFDVIDECKSIHGKKQVSARLWAYLGEHLMNICFFHHSKEYKVAYVEIKNMFP